jgi:hypothetical protein
MGKRRRNTQIHSLCPAAGPAPNRFHQQHNINENLLLENQNTYPVVKTSIRRFFGCTGVGAINWVEFSVGLPRKRLLEVSGS